MKHFEQIDYRLDPARALALLDRHAALWELFTYRQMHAGSAHKDTETILLRAPTTLEGVMDNLHAEWRPEAQHFSSLFPDLVDMLAAVKAQAVGRAMFVRLKPFGHITAHRDEGKYAEHYQRFHYVLRSPERCIFRCAGEQLHLPEGTLWRFDHQLEHEVLNLSEEPRIHLIFDTTTRSST